MSDTTQDFISGLRQQGFTGSGNMWESPHYKIRIQDGPVGAFVLVADKRSGRDIQYLSGTLANVKRGPHVNRGATLLKRIAKESDKRKTHIKDVLTREL